MSRVGLFYLPRSPLLLKLLQAVDGSTRVPLLSARSEMIPLLDIFQLQRDVSMMCLSSAHSDSLAYHCIYCPQRCLLLCAFAEELGQHI